MTTALRDPGKTPKKEGVVLARFGLVWSVRHWFGSRNWPWDLVP